MEIVKSEENLLEFDNGLMVIGKGDKDCCAVNYLDFEQFPVGHQFEDMDIHEFKKKMSIKRDGFSIPDKEGLPKWAQARSEQNGYYSNITTLILRQHNIEIECEDFEGLE